MLVIGLTGGIGSGKSMVAAMLRNADVPVVDADQLAKRVTEKNSAGLKEVVQAFGAQVLNDDGTLNRKRLASMVFADEMALRKLEAILHPKIATAYRAALAELEAGGHNIAVYMAPLLFEKQLENRVDKTLLIVAPMETRTMRLKTRDGLSQEEITQRMKAQLSDEERAKRADEIVENNGTIDELYKNLSIAWKRLTGLKLDGIPDKPRDSR
ncbi:MAG TPA: dephospho-CoA kinase [Myxococcota bacterium]|nr:dephospho-CoA kinase [Myxococcota bacterium]